MKSILAISETSVKHYAFVRDWKSDVEFLKLEIAFLRRLLDKNFTRFISNQMISELCVYGEQLIQLEKHRIETAALLERQIRELEWTAKQLIRENAARFREVRKNIEGQILDIKTRLVELRTNIFKMMERAKAELILNV